MRDFQFQRWQKTDKSNIVILGHGEIEFAKECKEMMTVLILLKKSEVLLQVEIANKSEIWKIIKYFTRCPQLLALNFHDSVESSKIDAQKTKAQENW